MKKILFAATVCIGIVTAKSPAFADRWVEPVNGTVSAVMMTDGEVMMKIHLPDKEFQVVNRNMRANNNSCIIKEIYSDSPDTMILICGKAGTAVQ
jgi:nitrate reductase alpha subunit